MTWTHLLETTPSTRKQRIKQLRKKARRKKIRRKRAVNNRKIDARKYYGVGVNEKRYKDIIRQAYNIDKVMPDRDIKETLRREDLNEIRDKALSLLGPSQDDITEITTLLVDSWEKGTRRVLNHEGENVATQVLENDEFIIENRLDEILQRQNTYFKNLDADINKEINQTIIKGRRKGESTAEITREIRKKVGGLTKHRANTISRTEVTKAHTEATKQVMEQAAVSKVLWLATLDNRTCQTCEDLHETRWDTNNAPTPVQDTHPNCRCTLIADQRND